MPQRYSSDYSMQERVISGLCYLPSLIGFVVGIVYILAKGRGCDGPFFRFHFYQSILLGFLGFGVVAIAQGSSSVIIGFARLFEGLIGSGVVSMLASNTGAVGRLLLAPVGFLVIYAGLWALLGRFTKIPFITDWIYNMLR